MYHAFELKYYYQVHLYTFLSQAVSFVHNLWDTLAFWTPFLSHHWMGLQYLHEREREREREMTTLYPTATWTNTFREERDFLVVDPWILALDEWECPKEVSLDLWSECLSFFILLLPRAALTAWSFLQLLHTNVTILVPDCSSQE